MGVRPPAACEDGDGDRHRDDRAEEQHRPERERADETGRENHESQRQRPSGADQAAAPPVVQSRSSPESVREKSAIRRAARSGGRERVHEGADRVAGGGVAGGGIAADRSDRGAPGGARAARPATNEAPASQSQPGLASAISPSAAPIRSPSRSGATTMATRAARASVDQTYARRLMTSSGIPTDSSTPNVPPTWAVTLSPLAYH